MYQITKNQIQDFIFSLNDNKGGFYLQKGFNQSTLMSTSFSILTLELIDSLNILKKKKNTKNFSFKIKIRKAAYSLILYLA